jgi:hypothetical protein
LAQLIAGTDKTVSPKAIWVVLLRNNRRDKTGSILLSVTIFLFFQGFIQFDVRPKETSTLCGCSQNRVSYKCRPARLSRNCMQKKRPPPLGNQKNTNIFIYIVKYPTGHRYPRPNTTARRQQPALPFIGASAIGFRFNRG